MNTSDNVEIVLNEIPADNLEERKINGDQLLKLMESDISNSSQDTSILNQEEILQEISDSLSELPESDLAKFTESFRLLSNLHSLISAAQLKEETEVKDPVTLDRLVSGFSNFVENFETAETLEGM